MYTQHTYQIDVSALHKRGRVARPSPQRAVLQHAQPRSLVHLQPDGFNKKCG